MAKKMFRTCEQELDIRLRWEQRKSARQEQLISILEDAAYYDTLTRGAAVLSRFGFIQRMQSRLTEVDTHDRRGETRRTCLLYLDLDDLKCVNDRYGHEAGDAVLKAFAAAVQATLRGSDILGRLGGDEFAVLSWVRGENGLQRITERIKLALSVAIARYEGTQFPISASVGAIFVSQFDKSAEALLRRADRLMYQDKLARKKAS